MLNCPIFGPTKCAKVRFGPRAVLPAVPRRVGGQFENEGPAKAVLLDGFMGSEQIKEA